MCAHQPGISFTTSSSLSDHLTKGRMHTMHIPPPVPGERVTSRALRRRPRTTASLALSPTLLSGVVLTTPWPVGAATPAVNGPAGKLSAPDVNTPALAEAKRSGKRVEALSERTEAHDPLPRGQVRPGPLRQAGRSRALQVEEGTGLQPRGHRRAQAPLAPADPVRQIDSSNRSSLAAAIPRYRGKSNYIQRVITPCPNARS